jgi:SlyX protein
MLLSEERIVNLETKISYQEDLIQELNRIVANQEKRLARQEERNDIIAGKIKELTDMIEEAPVSQKPPHY